MSRRRQRRRVSGRALLLVLLLLGACARPMRTIPPVSGPTHPPQPTVEERLRAEIALCRRSTGADASKPALDCSGFVGTVFKRLFGIDLPRTTRELARAGTPVSRDAICPGDLVFFRPAREMRHVGVYLGRGEFGHVSSQAGIQVSRMSEPYWSKSYWLARRVLTP